MPLVDRDSEHLRILSICQYVHAGLCALYAFFPILHLMIGLAMVFAPQAMCSRHNPANCPPPFIGWFFVGIAIFTMAMGFGFAISMFLTGRYISRRKHWLACIILSGLECIIMPTGTVLGIFNIVILTRPSVKKLFGIQLSPHEESLLKLSEATVIPDISEPQSQHIAPQPPTNPVDPMD